MVRKKKNERGKGCLLLAVCFTVILSASFPIGVDYVKQRLLKPARVSIRCIRKIIQTEAEAGGL
jgi:hypothetical protein